MVFLLNIHETSSQ